MKYGKIVRSYHEINSVYVSKENQPILLQQIAIEKHTKFNYPVASKKV
jgi:hypothetical protein